ncbi:helix-turn-helix domain-containing protein [Pseudomonas aeruginosa]|uniref:helix-turn-helix domain-containing protein n=4 Tax=Pseudomonas aeruginosa TaxID=287 RepID=UPI0039785752
MNDTTDSTLRDDMNIPQTLRTARKNRGLTQREVAELVGVSIEAYKGWEGGRHHPRSENVAPLAQALGISTDELMMEAQQRSISEDLRALFNAADKLPDDKKRQLRTAIKGMLLAISQEQLDEGVVSPVRQKSGITYTRLFSPATLAHQKVVRALPLLSRSSPEGQRAGGEKLPPTL